MKNLALYSILILCGAMGTFAQDSYHKFEVAGGYLFENAHGFPGDQIAGTATSGGTTSTGMTGTARTHNLNGFSASAVYNFSRYFGAKFEFSGNFGSDSGHELPGGVYRSSNGFTLLVIPSEGGIAAKQRDLKYLGGMQVKDNSKGKKWKPFAHALFGIAQQQTDFPNLDQQRTNLIGGRPIKDTSFSMAFGGGVDVKVSKRVDIRILQVDYNPTFTKAKVLVPNGGTVDSLVTSFSGGPIVTALQSVEIFGRTQNIFRIGAGIVIH